MTGKHCQEAEAALRVVEVVQAHARRVPAIRRAASRLSYDLIAVLSGLRAAFMLDYAVLTADQLGSLAAAAAAAWGGQGTNTVTSAGCCGRQTDTGAARVPAGDALAASCVVLTINGCHMVGRLSAVCSLVAWLTACAEEQEEEEEQEEDPLRAQHGPGAPTSGVSQHSSGGRGQEQQDSSCVQSYGARSPVLVGFRGTGASAVPYVLPRAEAQAVLKQLQPLHSALNASATTTAAATSAPGSAAPAPASDTRPQPHPLPHPAPHVHLDLDGMQGLPMQPTLQGLLLGYPLVYHVPSSDAAATASRCLSALGLVLQRMEAKLTPHVAAAVGQGQQGQTAPRGGRAGQVQGPERDLVTLCAFSLPRGLEEEEVVEAAVRIWSRRVDETAAGGMGEAGPSGGGRLWGECTLRSEAHATPSVAL